METLDRKRKADADATVLTVDDEDVSTRRPDADELIIDE